MSAVLTFRRATEFDPGTVHSILSVCFAEVLTESLEKSLRRFDREVFAHPDTVGACTLITVLADRTVGLVSYDPRPGPQFGIIGYNGILPPYQRKGYGSRQIREVIRILIARGFESASVTTSLHPFFEPAHRMYQTCGFHEVSRKRAAGQGHDVVLYQKNLGI